MSGSTPLAWTTWTYYGKQDTNNDHFVGYAIGAVTGLGGGSENYLGLYYSHSANKWRCQIRSTGGGIVATADLPNTPSTTTHAIVLTNNGAANSLTCSMAGLSSVTVTGTIPSGNMWFVAGSPGGVSNTFFEWTDLTIYGTGRGI